MLKLFSLLLSSPLFFMLKRFLSVSAKGAADTGPQLGLGAQRRVVAGGGVIRSSIAILAMIDVSCTADAHVASREVVTGGDAVVLLVEGDGRVLARLVGVAS